MKAIRKPITVEATKWLKDGDHASIKPYSRYDCPGHVICQFCGKQLKHHGQLRIRNESHLVCPGDWIIEEDGRLHVCKAAKFNEIYEEIKTI